MARYGRLGWMLGIALATAAGASLLGAAPEPARWALLICVLGFIGATLRLRRIDAGL